jgi:Cof subfamily protein (haloacid dehalogenase superfamily)
MMAIKALILDIDGTLIDKHSHRLPQSAVASIKHLRKSDIKIILATGRTHYSIDKSLLSAIKPDAIVSINGAVCQNAQGEIVSDVKINHTLVESFLDWTKTENLEHAFHMDHKTVVYHGQKLKKKLIKLIGHAGSAMDSIDQKEHLVHPVYNMIVLDAPLTKVQDFVLKHPTLRYDEFDPGSYDIFNKSINKSVGCDAALTMLGISWHEVMALGDNTNDIEMLRKANVGYVIKGGHPDIYKLGLPVTDAPLKDGLAKALGKEGLIPMEKNLMLLDSDEVLVRMNGSRIKISSLISAAFAIASLNEWMIKGFTANFGLYIALSLIMAGMAYLAYRKKKLA